MFSWKHRLFLGLALLSCVVVGYFTVRGMPGPRTQPEPGEGYRVEMILKARANPPDFWRVVEQGASVAAEEFGIDLTVTGPAREIDVDGQIDLVRGAIARKPDAIVLAAGDFTRLTPVCGEAVEAGIKLVIVDSDVDTDRKVSFVGTDNYLLGRSLAEIVDSVTGSDERFGVIGHVQSSFTCIAREQGLMDGVTAAPERLAAIEYCDSSVGLSREQCIEMLTRYPDIRCMVGLNESASLGICYALYDLGLTGQVKIAACDSSAMLIQFMENGAIQAVAVQNPFNMGYLSLKTAVDAVNGKAVEPFIDTGSMVIYKEDIGKKENQKLLFPFTEE